MGRPLQTLIIAIVAALTEAVVSLLAHGAPLAGLLAGIGVAAVLVGVSGGGWARRKPVRAGATTAPPSPTEATVLAAIDQQLERAYAPYSKFQVAAVVADDQGGLHAGCNVENAAYPIGNCAEASALAIMVAAGGARRARTVYVAAESGGTRMTAQPCGACRQRIAELAAPGCEVVVVGPGNVMDRHSLDALLPLSFSMPAL